MLLPLLLLQLGTAAPPAVRTPVAPLKPSLSPTRLPGCDAPPVESAVRDAVRDAVRARQALTAAQEAAMQGDQTRARTLLEEARRFDATNVRAVLELSRVLESANQPTAALAAACEALRRGVTGDDREELLSRRARHAEWARAAAAFGRAAEQEPSSSAAVFNQGVSLILSGQRERAATVLEHYLQLAPEAPERIAVARSFGALRRPAYSPTGALTIGLLPGVGQFATGRPAAGVLVLAAVGGSLAAAWHPVTRERQIPYLDPNGDPVPYTERYRAYPWRTAGIAGAATLTLVAALEARAFAARSNVPIRLAWSAQGPVLHLSLGTRR